MIARVTTADIDAVRTSVEDAVEVFQESVLPALHEQPGYEGSYVLSFRRRGGTRIDLLDDRRGRRRRRRRRAELLLRAGGEVRHHLPFAAWARVV